MTPRIGERRGSRMRLPRSERGDRGGASASECPPGKMPARNPRARSARLRAVEKLR